MKKLPKKLSTWLVPRLRRISMYWPGIQLARDKAKVFIKIGEHKNGNPHYKRYYVCQNCGLLCAEANEGSVDHINPIVDPRKGFENWEVYIPALFCNPDNLQFICNHCHDIKTQKEDKLRKKA